MERERIENMTDYWMIEVHRGQRKRKNENEQRQKINEGRKHGGKERNSEERRGWCSRMMGEEEESRGKKWRKNQAGRRAELPQLHNGGCKRNAC